MVIRDKDNIILHLQTWMSSADNFDISGSYFVRGISEKQDSPFSNSFGLMYPSGEADAT
jgi:hypothetical protein